MTRYLWIWIITLIGTIALLLGLGCLHYSLVKPFVDSSGTINYDPFILYKGLIWKASLIALAIPAFPGLMLFWDYATPDDWFKDIENAENRVLVIFGLVLVIGGILIWVAMDMLGVAKCSIPGGGFMQRFRLQGLFGALSLDWLTVFSPVPAPSASLPLFWPLSLCRKK